MQVILIEQVKNLGSVGDVVTVKNGFARNFLIPGKKALRATKSNLSYFEARKKELEVENQKRIAEATKLSKFVEKAMVVMVRQAGEDGRLYGSVKAQDICAGLVDVTKQKIVRTQIILHKPIKYIGVHTIEVELHPEVVVNIHVNVARSDADAAVAKQRFERGEVVMEGEEGQASKNLLEKIVPVVVEAVVDGEAVVAPANENAAEESEKPKKKARKKAEDSAASEEAPAAE